MLEGNRGRCPGCASGVFTGDGKCGKCNGTGINTQLDSAQPDCPYCHGSGVCATCGGSGNWSDEDRGPTIQTLFS